MQKLEGQCSYSYKICCCALSTPFRYLTHVNRRCMHDSHHKFQKLRDSASGAKARAQRAVRTRDHDPTGFVINKGTHDCKKRESEWTDFQIHCCLAILKYSYHCSYVSIVPTICKWLEGTNHNIPCTLRSTSDKKAADSIDYTRQIKH